MTQGYVFLGVDDFGKTQNIACAYALSLTLKLADPDRETCVVVNKFSDVPKRYENGFDYIVELPYGRSEVNHHNIFIDFWQLYYCTPFDESMFVNTYALAVESLDGMWDVARESDLVFASAKTFRGETFEGNRFDVHEKNKLPCHDVGVIFFRKEEITSEFFKMADPVFKGWRDVYREVHTEIKVNDFDFGLMVNTVAKLLGEQYTDPKLFTYTDLSIDFVQEDEKQYDWYDSLNIWFTKDLKLKINNHRLSGIVVYQEPRFLTDAMIDKINDHYNKETTKIAA